MRTLRLLTANLWNGRADPRALADAIARHAPDVLLAQELAPEQAAVIEAALPHGLLDPRRDTCGMGVALREPATVARLRLPHRDALCARLELGEDCAPLEILNVHLSAPTRLRRFALRRGQVRALRTYLTQAPMRRVLAGDLNSLPLMPAYRALRAELRDAARGGGRSASPTWSPFTGGPRFLRIDHVLVDQLRVLAFEVVPLAGSDHAALLVTLEV